MAVRSKLQACRWRAAMFPVIRFLRDPLDPYRRLILLAPERLLTP